jgi:riboflavin biosynthesis pyrimidine reductase
VKLTGRLRDHCRYITSFIASFLDEWEIDEFMIHVIPTFIGEGIPLIAPGRRSVPLKLISCTKFPDGVVKLHYAVRRT